MISYAEREVFGTYARSLFHDATKLVAEVDGTWGNELRCHELARAVCAFLSRFHRARLKYWHADIRVVDGRLGFCAHSWIRYTAGGHPYRMYQREHIIDVYCPGVLPQVLLIAPMSPTAAAYDSGDERTDINLSVIDQLDSAWAKQPHWEMHHE